MEIIQKAADWFVSVKAPDLKEKVQMGMEIIESKLQLSDNYKKLFGFILFDYSMHFGPPTFIPCEKAAIEIGVLAEMEEYAKSWICHSKKTTTQS